MHGVVSIINPNKLSDFDQLVEDATYGDIASKNGFNYLATQYADF